MDAVDFVCCVGDRRNQITFVRMEIRLLVFGALTDAVGCRDCALVLPLEITNVGLLRVWLLGEFKGLQNKTFRVAVNQVFRGDECNLFEGNEVSLMPPFSGG